MAIVVTAPEQFNPPYAETGSVFLAGAIDMGAAVDWQAEVINQLRVVDGLLIFNPRRAAFTADTLDEQIQWELKALHAADRVFMWFPQNAKAPVAMFETGLFMPTGKLVIGAEPGFYRRRNLELTCAFYRVPLYDNLDEMIGYFTSDSIQHEREQGAIDRWMDENAG